jgi:hypothetical protein
MNTLSSYNTYYPLSRKNDEGKEAISKYIKTIRYDIQDELIMVRIISIVEEIY